jgi:hypothetical protein
VSAAAAIACLGLLAACGSNTKAPDPTAGAYGPDFGANAGSIFGNNGLSIGTGVNHNQSQGSGTIGVNAYLWRGALDTLSFMPLSSADPFGGTIITDWYTPPGVTNERFKINAFITGRELRSDAVHISVFRQELQNGQWVDAPVSAVTVSDIDNRILDRARQIRAQLASQ